MGHTFWRPDRPRGPGTTRRPRDVPRTIRTPAQTQTVHLPRANECGPSDDNKWAMRRTSSPARRCEGRRVVVTLRGRNDRTPDIERVLDFVSSFFFLRRKERNETIATTKVRPPTSDRQNWFPGTRTASSSPSRSSAPLPPRARAAAAHSSRDFPLPHRRRPASRSPAGDVPDATRPPVRPPARPEGSSWNDARELARAPVTDGNSRQIRATRPAERVSRDTRPPVQRTNTPSPCVLKNTH